MPEPIRPDTKNGKVLNLLPNVIFYGIFLLFYNSRSFFQTVVDPRLNHILYKNLIYIVIRKNFVRAPNDWHRNSFNCQPLDITE